MLEEVIANRNTAISTLNLFREVKGLCQFIGKPKEDGTVMTFPAIYTGKDSFNFITNYYFRNGVLFHVQKEAVNIEPLETGMRANNDLLRYNYPMQCICIIGKKSIDDSGYTAEKLGLNVMNLLRGPINSLRTTLNLNRVDVETESIDTSTDQIDTIFQNVSIQFRHDLAIAVIDYTVILDGYQNCFTSYTC